MNGLYQVDHSIKTGGEIGGMAAEVVTIEELHQRMGHISPEATSKATRKLERSVRHLEHWNLVKK